MSNSIGYVFDWKGNFLTELIDIPFTRSWVSNSINNKSNSAGQCTFTISKNDTRCTLANLQYGNLLYIKHSVLPDWVGQISDQPGLTWQYGSINVTALSADVILSQRAIPIPVTATGNPGACIQQILDIANGLTVSSEDGAQAIQCTPITYGNIHPGGVTLTEQLKTDALSHIKNIVGNAQMDFDVTGNIDQSGHLILSFNLYETRGIDTNQTINDDDFAIDYTYNEQGPIHNYVIGWGTTGSATDSILRTAQDPVSASLYGPRSYNYSEPGAPSNAATKAGAESYMFAHNQVFAPFSIKVTDKSAKFPFMVIGNRFFTDIIAFGFRSDGTYGYNKKVKLSVVTYDDLSNTAQGAFEVA